MRLARPTPLLVATLALVSAWYVRLHVVLPHVPDRIAHERAVIDGREEPPYIYRPLVPWMSVAAQAAVAPIVADPGRRHSIGSLILDLLIFTALFATTFAYLRTLFSERAARMGVLVLHAVVPLAIDGYYIQGDILTVVFYAAGLWLIQRRRDAWLPPLVAVASLNREQMIFLVLLYALHVASRAEPTRHGFALLAASVAAWALPFFGLGLYYGFRPTAYTTGFVLGFNTRPDMLTIALPLWIAELGGLAVLAAAAYSRTARFLQLGLLSLPLYAVLFFFNGILWEFAKFLPAFLILIPVALQMLTDEFTAPLPRAADLAKGQQ